MGAIGIDFVFATEHASSSEQIIDTDLKVPHLDRSLDLHDVSLKGDVLRDMGVRRFAFDHELIYGNNGVNQEAALNAYGNRLPQGYLSHGVVPQIFLGGEIDVIPEVATGPSDKIPYGNGLLYDISRLCEGWQSWLVGGAILTGPLYGAPPCNPNKLWESTASGYLIRDVQGINEVEYGREHMIYLPSGPTDRAFIASNTGKYGGARRRLVETHRELSPILPKVEQKGYAFLAHPLNAPKKGNLGPDGPPWSEFMLRKAWASPAILGLQFWNENGRRRSKICAPSLKEEAEYACKGDEGGYEIGYERNEVTDILDIYDINISAKPINARREGFNQGAGKFELIPFDLETGEWGERSFAVEHNLHHGAFTWDRMNHWGLDLNQTRQLGWLAPGEPRRFFMAGGSDAHGDLNYRREGYFLGTTSTNDTAIGKPRNLVLVGRSPSPSQIDPNLPVDPNITPIGDHRSQINPNLPVDPNITPAGDLREIGNFELSLESDNGGEEVVTTLPHTQGQIIAALRDGRFSVTDGPALRIAIDQNGNNTIDAGDVQMGGIVHLDTWRLSGSPPLTVLVEWLSTPEFGPVTKIDLYVGVHTSQSDPDSSPRTYAPQAHGIRDCSPDREPQPDPPSSPEFSYTSGGKTHTKMQDGYWLDDTLRIIPRGFTSRPRALGDVGVPINDGYTGTGVWSLDLNQFEVKQGRPGDRFFIRAFAQTRDTTLSGCAVAGGVSFSDPIPRYAFTNPIWVIKNNLLTPVDTIDPRVPQLGSRGAQRGLKLGTGGR
jgi:hypothetical protein